MKNTDHEVKLPPYTVDKEYKLRSLAVTRSWGVDFLDAPVAWDNKVTGNGCVVFIVDTEDRATHPDVAPFTVPAYNRRHTDEGDDVESAGGHGLHVAHTVLQVAPGAALAFQKVLRNAGAGRASWVAAGIRAAADMELLPEHQGYRRLINLSLGSPIPSSTILDALAYAINKGCYVFCAAGNDGSDVDFPGGHEEESITISAINKAGDVADFSSRGPAVDLAAPGVRILAAWRDGYAELTGTSMATPHALGVGALLLDRFPELKTHVQLEAFLENQATDIAEPGEDDVTGAGAPIVSRYLGQDPGPPPPPPPGDEGGVPWWVWVVVGAGGLIAALIAIF